jgi:hypothetical protein
MHSVQNDSLCMYIVILLCVCVYIYIYTHTHTIYNTNLRLWYIRVIMYVYSNNNKIFFKKKIKYKDLYA